MNGFDKSGIFPVNGKAVIQKVKEKKKSLLAVTNPAFQSLLPKETRFKDALEQIRESLTVSTKKDQEAEIRRQRRRLKQLRKEEDNRLKEEWKKNYKYDINNNGKPVHISLERWKKWKQLDIYDEIIYIPPPSQEALPTPEEGFFYDTSGSAQRKRFYERLRDSTAAGFYRSPLQDIPAVRAGCSA
ncbi:hypothetical protein FNYG_00005 [Fusarium nygamai]|uniref:Uncharacterized protein n=1 Tax=Gibberella nygamai TaxID=42673 RepID=A0A2K0WWJ7_GIBNY|nr:hypothetical protein FNYG_00005 [Fusarium nygamai]